MAEITTEEVLNKVRQAFSDAIDAEEGSITIESTPDDIPGWDSLGHVVLGSSLETIFEVSLDVDELMEMEDVESVVKIMQAKLS